MSRTRRAIVASAFQFTQFGLALASGFVLFPLVIRYLGAYDNGLWLATGEVVGYLLLGDLGVFAVLPWLIAARDGAGDRAGINVYLANAIAIGLFMGLLFVGLGAVVWLIDPNSFGIPAVNWGKVRTPLAVMMCLTGFGFPLRVFNALLMGLQDVATNGLIGIAQTALTIALTASLIANDFGLVGMSVANGLPPLLGGIAAGVRSYVIFSSDLTSGSLRPSWSGCWRLIGEGIGVWIGGFGVRLMSASNSMIFASLGRPDWATVFSGTGKAAQVINPMCAVVPDSGLVGHCELWGEGDRERARQSALCLLLLYLLIPGAAAVGLLAANPAFVRVWIGPDLYAGHMVSALIALNLVVGGLGGGLYKVVAVVGYRRPIGIATVAAGIAYAILGYTLGSVQGLVGVAAGGVIVSTCVIVPIGLNMLSRVYGIGVREFVLDCLLPWSIRAFPVMAVAWWSGEYLAGTPEAAFPASVCLCLVYLIALRPLIDRTRWPSGVRRWLARMRLAGPA